MNVLRRLALAAALSLALPAAARAHETLRSSEPARDARLTSPPPSLRLVFSRRVEPAVSELRLTGPAGAVALSSLRGVRDSAAVLVADVTGAMAPGRYVVAWRVAGADGHPVRGEFAFTLLAGPGDSAATPADAAALPAAGEPAGRATVATPAAVDAGHAGMAEPSLDASSPAFVVVRGLLFAAILASVGAAVFRFLVLPRAVRTLGTDGAPFAAEAARRAAAVLRWAAMLLLPLVAVRLPLQSAAMHGAGRALEPAFLLPMIAQTVWGLGWLLQVAAALVLVVAVVRRETSAASTLAAVAAVALAFTPALSGHAAAMPIPTLGILLDGLHVLGAGAWLGTLLLIATAALPAARATGQGARAAAATVGAFSPLALGFASLVAATGLVTAFVHLGSVDALLHSSYGQLLLVKLGAVALVAAVGAVNWRVVRPSLAAAAPGDEAAPRRVQRTATAELCAGALVLAVTALLVAVSPPRHDAAPAAVAPARNDIGR